MKFRLEWLKKRDAGHYLVEGFEKRFGKDTTVEKLVDWLHNLYRTDYWEAWILGQDDAVLVELMLKAGADPNAHRTEALKRAAGKGRLNTVKVLCFWGADTRIENDSVFKVAAGKGYLKIAKFLKNFDESINVHAGDEYALKEAVRNNYIHVVDYLLSLGSWHENIIKIAEKWGRDRMRDKLLIYRSLGSS